MIYVGIDVAKDKHDCFITNSNGEVLYKPFTISNNREGFDTLFQRIESVSDDFTKVKVGLEATGHYSYNLLGFLLDKGLPTYVINPLHTNLYRKSLSLRKTKTDKVDSRTIATMIMSDMNLKSYSDISYHNEELKSLTRYRFDKVKEQAKLKTSVSRLVNILFLNWRNWFLIHLSSVYALLSEFQVLQIAASHLTKLVISYPRIKGALWERRPILFQKLLEALLALCACKSLEAHHQTYSELTAEIDEIEAAIKQIMDENPFSYPDDSQYQLPNGCNDPCWKSGLQPI